MARAIISDLSGKLVDQHVRMVIRQHPQLSEPKQLDTDYEEVANLQSASGNFVVVQLYTDAGSSEPIVMDLKAFEALFKGKAADALDVAPKAAAGGGGKQKRDPAYLQELRTWARANGWPQLSDRGRVPREAEDAYLAASG